MPKIRQAKKRVAPLQPLPVISEPFHRIAMDFTGPLPRSKGGKCYIIVAMDYATKWPEAKAVTSPTSKADADLIVDITNHFGVSVGILTDREAHFVGTMMRQLYKQLRIHKITTTPYHPQQLGWLKGLMLL